MLIYVASPRYDPSRFMTIALPWDMPAAQALAECCRRASESFGVGREDIVVEVA